MGMDADVHHRRNKMAIPHSHYTDYYHAIGGWQSKMIAYYPDDEMWDVVQTGLGPYKTAEEAKQDAKEWAKAEGIPYKGGD